MLTRILFPIALVGLLVIVTTPVLAAGTASGTNIENYATVDYTVGGIPQTPVLSDTAAFVVDNKIDLLVATVDVAPVSVVPGDTLKVQTFTVTNEGNTVQDFSLAATHSATPAFGEASEDFDATSVNVYVDANGNGTYDVGVDVATYIDELDPDSTRTVFIVANIPLAQLDGDVSSLDLTAQVAAGGSSGSQGSDILTDDSAALDIAGTVQTVFADSTGTTDGDEDGRHSSKDAYKVASASLTVSKDGSVNNDPINGTTNPKAIPGAVMDYEIDVANNGTTTAANVVVVDEIPVNTAYVVGSESTTPGVGPTVEFSDDSGATWTYSPSAGPDGSDTNVTHVRVTFTSIANGATGEVDFQVLIL